jgi:hypothetical protein
LPEAVVKTVAAVLVLVFLTLGLAGCKDAPGANGEYATHDRGYLNRGP